MVNTCQDCLSHEGITKDIKHLEKSDDLQWKCINSMKNRINLVLGGVCVSCILLVINLAVKG